MRSSREHSLDASAFLRSLPPMFVALIAVVMAVDLLLLSQPGWLEELSHSLRSAVVLRPVLVPSAHLLAAAVAVATVVLASAVLLTFAHAARLAPHASIASAWVALCMLSVTRVEAALPLPMSTQVFATLSALLFAGAGTSLRSGARAGAVLGWLLIVLPFAALAGGYLDATHVAHPFGADAIRLFVGLALSAAGVVLVAFTRSPERGRREVEGLEGVDVVDELFAQVERAERSEARVAELERQLRTYTRQPTLGPRAITQRSR